MIFQGGGGPHIFPLDPHMRFHNLFFLFQKETLAVASQKIPLKKTIHLSTKTNVWTYRQENIHSSTLKKCLSGPMLCNVTGPQNWILTMPIKAV